MVKLLRFVLALLLLCVSFAHAGQAVSLEVRFSSFSWAAGSTLEGACAAFRGVLNSAQPQYNYIDSRWGEGQCGFHRKSVPDDGANPVDVILPMEVRYICADGSRAVTANTCPDGTGGGGPPPTDACAANVGKVGVINFTEGYTRTPDEGDRMAVVTGAGGGIKYPPADGNFCQNGCKVSAQISGPGVQPWVSQFPTAQGLYRRSLDLPTVALGTPCTANDSTDQSIKPDAPPPECPGAVGEVNGRTACVGTAAKPVYAQPLGQAPGAAIAGNPTSGPKPATGEGSGTGSTGRTPTSGDGANGGGPGAAAVGGKGGGAGGTAAGSSTGAGTGTGSSGTGTVPKPGTGEEQAACGAPGQPKCAIDETGTPDGTNAFDAAKAAQDKNESDTKAAIDGAANMQGPQWSFAFQLPTGCTSYQVGTFKGLSFSMNPCTYQPTIHDLMSMVWAAATAMCLIAMVGKTIREA